MRNIVLQARHIPGRLNMTADKLSHYNQIIEWSVHQRIFNQSCHFLMLKFRMHLDYTSGKISLIDLNLREIFNFENTLGA